MSLVAKRWSDIKYKCSMYSIAISPITIDTIAKIGIILIQRPDTFTCDVHKHRKLKEVSNAYHGNIDVSPDFQFHEY